MMSEIALLSVNFPICAEAAQKVTKDGILILFYMYLFAWFFGE